MNRTAVHLIYIATAITIALIIIGGAALLTFIFTPQATGKITLAATLPATLYAINLHHQLLTKDREEREALNTQQ